MAGIGGMMKKIKMINTQLGTEMLVAEDRVEEYKAAGHTVVGKATTKPAKVEKKKSKK